MKLNKFDSNTSYGKRIAMVEEIDEHLKSQGFKSYNHILDAFSNIPRHFFLPKGFEPLAYDNKSVDIDNEQTMSTPNTVAVQTLLLDPKTSDKVLEIGTGSGYQASILSSLVTEVHTIERHKTLHKKASKRLKDLSTANVHLYLKDGFEGLEEKAPFDKIIITCGAPEIPKKLISQLKTGGRMVIPVDNTDGEQTMKLIIKNDAENYSIEEYGSYNFVPMLNGINNI